jgi:hypothetical protein
MLAKIKAVKLLPEHKNPIYKVKLECPDGSELLIKFDYTYSTEAYMPFKVYSDGVSKGAQLAWYTRKVEKTTVQKFLKNIAQRINKKYKFDLKTHELQIQS